MRGYNANQGSGGGGGGGLDVQAPIRGAKYYGIHTVESRPGFDAYQPLMDALQDASEKGYELQLEAGTYETSQGIVATGVNHRIAGAGGGKTIIKCLDVNDTVLALGPGASGSGLTPSGYIKDLTVSGPQQRPDTNTAGLLLDGLRFFHVQNVRASGTTFGFDLKNNSYGSYFTGARAIFGECQVGVLLRGKDGDVWGSGSDLSFRNCWLGGNKAAVWVHRDGGGYHFKNGQLSMGFNLTGDNDILGVVVYGIDYFDNTKLGGVGNMSFEGIDFEGWHHGWAFRGNGRANIYVNGVSFLATSTTNKAMGILKVTTAENGQYKFDNCTVDGQYSQAKSLNFSGQGSALALSEDATTFGYNCYFNGVQAQTGATMCSQSDFAMGTVSGRVGSNPYVGFGRTRLRSNSGQLEISNDHGATYKPVDDYFVTTTAARPTTGNYAGRRGFDTTLNKPIWRNAANDGWIDSAGASV